MLWMDYYLHLCELEESQRNKEILLLIAVFAVLFFIVAGIEFFKYKYLDKIKNRRIKEFIMNL